MRTRARVTKRVSSSCGVIDDFRTVRGTTRIIRMLLFRGGLKVFPVGQAFLVVTPGKGTGQ